MRSGGETPFYRRWWFLVLLFALVWVIAFTLGRSFGRQEKAAQTVVTTTQTRPARSGGAPETETPSPETEKPRTEPWLDLVPSPPPIS